MTKSVDVARMAGVSRSTVSRTLNGSPHVSPDARERVLAAVARMEYKPDIVARSLVRQQSRTIALGLFSEAEDQALTALSHPQRYFYVELLTSIEGRTVTAGYDLVLPAHRSSDTNRPADYLHGLRARRVAGALMVALDVADPRVQVLLDAALPVVFVDAMIQGAHATYIKSDNIDGARQAMDHLLHLGHRSIAILCGPPQSLTGGERLLGYQQAFARWGIQHDPNLVRPTAHFEIEEAYEATRALLATRRDVTAIVAVSDMMGIGVLRAAYEHGLRVPDDLSVVGFDDIDLAAYTTPPLTSVRQDRAALGQGAVDRLIAMIDGVSEALPLIVPTQLIVRKSTAPPPAAGR